MLPRRVLSALHGPAGPAGPALALDLSEVDALSAGGLGELAALSARLRGLGGRLVLRNVGPRAYEALDVSGLAALLDVRPAEGAGHGDA